MPISHAHDAHDAQDTRAAVRPLVWLLAGLAIPCAAFAFYEGARARSDDAARSASAQATTTGALAQPPRARDPLSGGDHPAAQPQPQSTEAPLANSAVAVLIRSAPLQAHVFQGERDLGKTPYALQVAAPTRVTVKLAGYMPYDLELTPASKSDLTVRLAPLTASVPTSALPAPSVVALPQSPVRALASMPRHMRQQSMLVHGSPYANVALTKRAYQRGEIDGTLFDDIVWALKTQRKDRLAMEKANYRNGLIARGEYERRVRQIDYRYAGE